MHESPLWIGTPHRHVWRSDGRWIDVCEGCPAARRRSQLARRLSLFVVGLGLLAAVGMFARISTGDGRIALASGCPSFAAYHTRGGGPGC